MLSVSLLLAFHLSRGEERKKESETGNDCLKVCPKIVVCEFELIFLAIMTTIFLILRAIGVWI